MSGRGGEKSFAAVPERTDTAELAGRLEEEIRAASPGKRTLLERLLGSLLPDQATEVPGRQTLAGELADVAPVRSTQVELGASAWDRLRTRGLQEVLAALDSVPGGPGLIRAAVSAAKRATRPAMPSQSARPAPPDPAGQAMWQTAERRAATLYRRALDGECRVADPAVDEALRRIGSGQALPAGVRRMMERELGVALDRVRVHLDAVAAAAARAVCAEAFTVGEDIFFAEGAFAPETARGAGLLAHELAHVVQGWQRRTDADPDQRVSQPGDALEREADAVADRLGSKEVHRAAQEGVSGRGGPLPYLDSIQASFGPEHDLSQVQAHIGGKAAEAASRIGAEAYATGNRIAFRDTPSLHTAAHEAAHVAQQAAGLGPASGVGQAGDEHERNADAIADRVVQGRSATDLLPPARAAGGPPVHAVQRAPSSVTPSAAEQLFNAAHVYSTAPEAALKRQIDEDIMGGDFGKGHLINMNSATYLKELISRASKGKTTVQPTSTKLQFFIIKGGAEGFLAQGYRGKDASNVTHTYRTTSNTSGTIMRFDNNDLIAVFGTKGQLISSALLERPLSITNPNIWTEATANKVYDAWDKQPVSLYQNNSFEIKYMGLQVNDSLGEYTSGRTRIDLHKKEQTNGCIFLLDPNTPSLTDPAALNAFEPKFITDVMNEVGAKRYRIGIMHMITIK